ncbi:MAG: hypothetical protein C0392_01085 [Syntrophus sp. (in: bacteria)]|nr:hypothetical protein [Syntrophus sp. (in: bacteria)]
MADQRRNGKKLLKLCALAMALLLIGGIVWIFFEGMREKEGRIKVVLVMTKAKEIQDIIENYYIERKMLPSDNDALRLPGRESTPYLTAFEERGKLSYRVHISNGVLTVTFSPDQRPLSGKTLIFVPRISDEKFDWTCDTGSVDLKYRPLKCRGR